MVAALPETGAQPNKFMITVVTMMATIVQALDATIVNVALPHMEGSLGATTDQISWVLTSYIITAAIMTPATGWLAGRLGRTRLLVWSLVGFTVVSLFCGIATSITEMVFFRILQGILGAALMPLSQAILLDTHTRAEMPRAMAIWGMGVMVAPILGPTVGGWLTEEASWRWCFYINLPIGILTILGAIAFVPETKQIRDRRFDWLGFFFLSLSIAALQLLLDRGEGRNWFASNEIKVEGAIAVFGLYMFVVHSMTTHQPFISMELFKDRNFILCVLLATSTNVVFNGTFVLAPQLLQTELNYPVVTAGILMGPRGFGTIFAMVLFSRLSKVDPRLLIGIGSAAVGWTMYRMSGWSLYVSPREFMLLSVVQGAGMGLSFAPMTTLAFGNLPAHLRTEASGFYALVRNVGGAVGISIVVSRLSELTQANHAHLSEFMTPFRRLSLPGQMSTRAMEMMNLDLTHQAGMIAYVNVFRLLAVLSVVFIPLLFLISNRHTMPPPPGSDAAAAH
ncbi:MAG TPA: DHA2 family efflux MFS transporter permease subunit [Alphaproteobacteria bacterium]|jgi:DHA2 family multidrug resistance protein|nr:DHA2 family efflux MFS transporter permease subunit [Alphaproteobacteria bacterium]